MVRTGRCGNGGNGVERLPEQEEVAGVCKTAAGLARLAQKHIRGIKAESNSI